MDEQIIDEWECRRRTKLATEAGLPNFMVIGAPRCGTTALCRALSQHPELFMTEPKETFFFSHHQKYLSEEGWRWYQSLFDSVTARHTAIGEGTTDYSDPDRFHFLLPRLREHVPHCRFIYIVRHPLRRIESAWKLYAASHPGVSFATAVREHPRYIGFSSYWKVLDAYSAEFGRDRILVIFHEDFQRDPAGQLRRCFEYLGISTDHAPASIDVINPSTQLRRRPRFVQKLRNTGAGELARRFLPQSFRNLLHVCLTSSPDISVEWDDDTLAIVHDELQEGIARFLADCGKPGDYWQFGRFGSDTAQHRPC